MVTEKEVLTNLVLHWRLYSVLPSKDELADYLGCKPNDLTVFLEDEEFQNKCIEKGLPVGEQPKLSPRQIQVLGILLNPVNGQSFQQKLEEAGIDGDTYANWMKQPEFRRAMTRISEGNVEDAYPAIMQALTNKAVNGNQRAIEYLFEVTGRYRRQQDVNPQLILTNLIEILSRQLAHQPEVLLAISDEIEGKVIKGELH